MAKTILVTGAGSGFGEGAAIGMAKNGHNVIATVQVSPQVTPLREKAKALGLKNLTVERLDLTRSLRHRAGAVLGHRRAVEQRRPRRGRPGLGDPGRPCAAELRDQRLPAAGADPGRRPEVGRDQEEGQGGLHLVDGRAVHAGRTGASTSRRSTHSKRSPRRCSKSWRRTASRSRRSTPARTTPATTRRWPTIRSGGSTTRKHFTKRADLRKGFDDFFATPEGKMDPKEMIDRMIEIVPADTGLFRNVVPQVRSRTC